MNFRFHPDSDADLSDKHTPTLPWHWTEGVCLCLGAISHTASSPLNTAYNSTTKSQNKTTAAFDALEPLDLVILLRRQALSEANQGRPQDAIAILDYLIAQSHSALDYNNRGLMYHRLGDLTKAIQDYDAALHHDPDLDSVYNNRANCYSRQGEKHLAIADYDRAIDLNPLNFKARINLAITLRELGDHGEAIATLETALMLCRDPELTAHIYAERGRTHYLSGDWNCAVADYRRAIAQLQLLISTHQAPLPRSQELMQRVTQWLSQLSGGALS